MYYKCVGKKKSLLHAFSLIELMVVVSIIGILSVVAVPAYTNEMMRSRIASLIPLADGVKVDVMEQHSYGTVFSTTTETEIATGATDKPKYLDSLVRDVYGCVTVQYDTGALGLDGSKTLALVYCPLNDSVNNLVSWNCGYSASSESTYTTYLPDNCRQEVSEDTTF